MEELNLGDQGKIQLLRKIVGGYFIDTSDSRAYISARWLLFVSTLVVLWMLFNWLLKKCRGGIWHRR